MFHTDRYVSAAGPVSVFSFIHDLVQYNVAGVPLIHEASIMFCEEQSVNVKAN